MMCMIHCIGQLATVPPPPPPFSVGVIQGLGAITSPPLASRMSKAVSVQDQGDSQLTTI